MREEVLQTIKLLLANDPSVSAEQRNKILTACRSPSGAVRRRMGTVKQAAEILGCCTRTVERWAKDGCFHCIHHSPRRVRYDLDEVETFRNNGVNTQTEAR